MRTHTGERNFNCNLCTLQFRSKGNLRAHITNIHENKSKQRGINLDKPIVCEICGFTAKQKSLMNVNI